MALRATSSEERIMKRNPCVFASGKAGVFVIGLMVGCAAPRLVRIPQSIGPAPIVLSSLNTGRLVVYTEEIGSGSGDDMINHEPYTVLDSSGRLLKKIDNRWGDEVVSLQAGRYFVRAGASGGGVIAIEVQIVAGRTTEVHLDGKWTPEASSTAATLVFGPDGSPVGYQCTPITCPY